MSAHAPHSVPSFSLRLKAVATAKCPASIRAPQPLDVPLKATYYDLAEGVNTPWVADVDLEGWFFSSYKSSATRPDSDSSRLPQPPHYPGYRVPPVGQLQMIVKTSTAAVKVFVIPYDLRELQVGGRLLARERTYVASTPPTDGPARTPSSPNNSRESLRYAVQLQFICTHAPAEESSDEVEPRAFYVARTLKLVFTSRPPESTDPVRDDRADEVVPPASINSSPQSRSADSRSEDWTRVRRKYIARTVGNEKSKKPIAPAAVRGFSPSRERPSTPAAITSPRSLLSALDPRGEDEEDRSITPTPGSIGTSIAGALLSPTPLIAPTPIHVDTRVASPRPPSVAESRRRRGSRNERELSERLRALELRK